MANPSPPVVDAIRANADWLKSDGEILAAIQADSVPNPVPQPQIPAPISEDVILATIGTDPDAIDRLNAYPHLDHLLENLASGDLVSLGRWFILLTRGTNPVITADHAAVLQGMLTATIPDPNWRPTIPRIEMAIGRPIDLEDVAASRPGA